MNTAKAILLAALAAAAAEPAAEPDDEALLAAGSSVVAPFRQALKGALLEGMARGPVAAVEACRLKAPAIARDVMGASVRLGRASDRLRNPANRAPEWVAPLLADYLAGRHPLGSRAVRLGDGRAGYVEPIETAPLCLTCHGTALTPEVTEILAEHYPQDRATGYRAGELRGVFWAEFDVPR